jgi:threonyl-tRNA synthetase
MIHQAVLGSLERFIGMLLENCGGQLPLWLAPEQVAVLSIEPAQAAYAAEVAAAFEAEGLRATLDDRAERLPRKIVDAHAAAIPLIAVVGAREAAAGTLMLRCRDAAQREMTVKEAVAALRPEAFR